MSTPYIFTTRWFEKSELRPLIPTLLDASGELHILEIGSHEGASACAFADAWLEHPNSSLTCVDPFLLSDRTTYVTLKTFKTFQENIAKCNYPSKVALVRKLSRDFFKDCNQLYNFIYVDGSHEYDDIKHDIEQAYEHSAPDGIIWCDDYVIWPSVKKAVDEWLAANEEKVRVIYKRNQIAFQRIQ